MPVFLRAQGLRFLCSNFALFRKMAHTQHFATRVEMGHLWHCHGVREWKWFHDTDKDSEQESGVIKFLTGNKLYSSMYSHKPASWHHGQDGEMVLSFGTRHHFVVLESSSPPLFKVVRRALRDVDAKKRKLFQQPNTVGVGVEVACEVVAVDEEEGADLDEVHADEDDVRLEELYACHPAREDKTK